MKRQNICINFCFVIGVNKIANLVINFKFNHRFWGLSNEKDAKVDKNSLPAAWQCRRLFEDFLNKLELSQLQP